jgi:hypothetical protein
MWKNPEKSGFRRIFSFTPALSIPYHLVANAGSGGDLESLLEAHRTREKSEKGELWQQQR